MCYSFYSTVLLVVIMAKKVSFPKRRGSYYYYLGEKFVSVTNVLQMLAKPALITWAAKTASGLVLDDPERFDTVEKAVGGLYKTRDKSGERGTDVHTIAEQYGGGVTDIAEYKDTEMEGFSKAVESFFTIVDPKVLYTEVNVYSRVYGYAGTADLIAEIGEQIWLLDYKTSKAVYPEMGLQLEAYKSADFALIDGEEVTLPVMDRSAVVLLKKNGTFVFHPIDGDMEVFLALKKVWDWKKSLD